MALNGVDPILIFEFKKKVPDVVSANLLAKIPFVSADTLNVSLPPIPFYMNERLTGLLIDSEDKTVDIQTEVETLANGAEPQTTQKGQASTVKINIRCRKDSIGVVLLSALIDQVFSRVSANEYTLTYLHGSVTVFRGLLSNYTVNQTAGGEIASVTLEITKGSKDPAKPPATPAVPGYSGEKPPVKL